MVGSTRGGRRSRRRRNDMKAHRAIAQTMAAVALVAALAIGSAVYTVAGGGSDIAALANVAHAVTSSLEPQARRTA